MSPSKVVYLLDSDQDDRQHIKEILGRVAIACFEFESVEDLYEHASTVIRPDAVIFDHISMGLEIFGLPEQLLKLDIGSVLATRDISPSLVSQFFKGGVSTLLLKPIRSGELIEELSQMDRRKVRKRRLNERLNTLEEQFSRLSTREMHVLSWISDGHKNRHIASQLGVAKRTVENYREQIKEKLAVGTMQACCCLYAEFLARKDCQE